MATKGRFGFHLLALLTACLWGTTFVASKILLNSGLTPAQIMCVRFAIAYLVMLPFCHSSLLPSSWRDELMFLMLGLSGGSLYFLLENTAVKITTSTSTVAMLVATTPIVTALLMRCFYRSARLSMRFLVGSIIALCGVALVIFNGVWLLDDDPLVIILSLGGSLSWAVYSLVLRKVEVRYSSAVITRKVFFWGVLTMLPLCIAESCGAGAVHFDFSLRVVATMLFLAIVASLGCYQCWNVVCARLGVVTASNYLYFNPVTSLVAAWAILDERITMLAILGCFMVIAGVYLCNKKQGVK